jgi:hypothetical protein
MEQFLVPSSSTCFACQCNILMKVNKRKEVNVMKMPGFTAERSLTVTYDNYRKAKAITEFNSCIVPVLHGLITRSDVPLPYTIAQQCTWIRTFDCESVETGGLPESVPQPSFPYHCRVVYRLVC